MALALTLINLQKQIQRAQVAYTGWQKGENIDSERAKITSGWFSWFRHGIDGRENAIDFSEAIEKAGDEKVALTLIDSLLKNASLHCHSFASFLLDELAKFEGLEQIPTHKLPDGKYDNMVYQNVFAPFNNNVQAQPTTINPILR